MLGIGLYKLCLKYLFPIEPTGRAVAASGDGIMLTKLLQFQAQGWEKWLSRITALLILAYESTFRLKS
jgi:hypothetical protein